MEGDPAETSLSEYRAPPPFTRMLRRTIAVMVFGSWTLSLWLPAAYFVQVPGTVRGYEVLLLGWLGVIPNPAWLANIGLFVMLPVFLYHGKPGGCLLVGGGIAMGLCAISALFWNTWPQGSNLSKPIIRGSGFYFWTSAVAGIAVAALLRAATRAEV